MSCIIDKPPHATEFEPNFDRRKGEKGRDRKAHTVRSSRGFDPLAEAEGEGFEAIGRDGANRDPSQERKSEPGPESCRCNAGEGEGVERVRVCGRKIGGSGLETLIPNDPNFGGGTASIQF